ncbi:conserved hypothetical protein [Pyrenophora tritici-repentis Pt-1C-BFP]|uniref:Uncharacterized protein n=3 Tax=Pyrenophora tritici-repentis TaxID=45151 RepID=A0A922ND37_9PLEO|nr:uncharacterized protein PTRG_01592 [Pyrenophora tritici-repentis Pt-1C-BFP]EDU41030.1 conserved hypothetical protein [Pyrenophora tritici-repentis Pt-1C-BFP]KAI1513726.1 hypothetical protein Ptr86124_007628 [Pyrenophora tritici-repentis]
MLGQILTVAALMALTQAKAIVTNNCPFTIYVWSVPDVPHGSRAKNLPIKSGGRYQEPWRLGSVKNPGVSIKISSRTNGIYDGADEIDFAYSIDPKDDSKIWVDLSKVRGEPPKVRFHTCRGEFFSTNPGTVQCTAADEVELVLCGPTRSTLATDTASLEQIKACYDDKHTAKIDYTSSGSSSDSSDDEWFDWWEARKQVQSSSASQPTDSVPDFFPDAAYRDYHAAQEKSDVPQCQAKVFYKRSQRIAVPSDTMETVPADTMQYTSDNKTLALCNLLQLFHPMTTIDCDEVVMKDRAEKLYPRICDPAVEPLLMGFPCQEVKHELRTKYLDSSIDAAQELAALLGATGTATVVAGTATVTIVEADDSVTMVENDSTPVLAGNARKIGANASSDKECFMTHCVDDYEFPSTTCATLEHIARKVLEDFDLDWYKVFDASCPSPERGPDATQFRYADALCHEHNKDSKVCRGLDRLIRDFALDYYHKDVCFTTDKQKCET